MKCQLLLQGRIRKISVNLLSAEFADRMVSAKHNL